MNFLFRVLICCSLLTCFLLLFQANIYACHWIFKKHHEEVRWKFYLILSSALTVLGSGGLKEDNRAQNIEEVPRSTKSCWAWPVRVRWAQSSATLPHRPGQNWWLVWGDVPPSSLSPSALVFPSRSVLVSSTWLASYRLSKTGENSWDNFQECGQSLWTGFVACVLYSRTAVLVKNWQPEYPLGKQSGPGDLFLGLHRWLSLYPSPGCGHVSADECSFEQCIPG